MTELKIQTSDINKRWMDAGFYFNFKLFPRNLASGPLLRINVAMALFQVIPSTTPYSESNIDANPIPQNVVMSPVNIPQSSWSWLRTVLCNARQDFPGSCQSADDSDSNWAVSGMCRNIRPHTLLRYPIPNRIRPSPENSIRCRKLWRAEKEPVYES